jgi:hypothetical protein
MKRTLSSTLALANLLLLAILPVFMWVLFTRVDPLWWVTRDPRWLSGFELGIVLLVFLLLFIMPLVTLTLAVVDVWRGSRRQALLSAATSLVLFVALLLWLGFGDRLASHQEARAERAWAKTLESMDDFLARYPEAPASEPALRVGAAAARIGVDLDPFDAKGSRSAEADGKAFQLVQQPLLSFVASQTRNADDALDAPPPQVSAWLSAHDAGIAALVAEVNSGGTIAFATDWSSARRPEPSTIGVRNVACVIVLRALDRERHGDSQTASAALEASWRLGGALRERGELINQIVALGVDSTTLGALRKLRDPPHPWRVRLTEQDRLRSILRALEGEAWTRSAGVNGWTAMDQMRRRHAGGLFRRMERPYVRLMAADSSLAWAGMVAELKTVDPCRAEWATLRNKAEGSSSRWNFMGRVGVSSGIRAWFSAVRTALEAEMTRNVLAARELRNERGVWPSELPGLESSVCPGARWDYSTSPNGWMSLSIRSNPSLGDPIVFHAGVR